jgi:putative tricarboxylic transport membrane protein
LGATPAAFVSYDRARHKAKDPNRFGKGSLEGIAAAEAGNNGVNGATLVPLLTLGIPGDVITAVMLGAFMIFDLKPGPMLFIEHIDLIFGLFCALLMCDVALRIVGIIFIRYAEKIATGIPTSIIFPAILVLCVFGSYSINNSTFDVFIMLVFGVLGYFMVIFEVPAVPFLIAFVLAPMLEKGLRRSLTISGGDPLILLSPISIAFYILTILAVISLTRGFLRKLK